MTAFANTEIMQDTLPKLKISQCARILLDGMYQGFPYVCTGRIMFSSKAWRWRKEAKKTLRHNLNLAINVTYISIRTHLLSH